ncbi:YraN family protein [Gorillibacterium sp. CAU 1737]|uniref:YraN family protein n=1 Tax=Gorillibacterium sp. CAU 1737 TaxID=3140362 RepID=UPI0032617716
MRMKENPPPSGRAAADTRRRTGTIGEEAAARYLQEKGYTLLQRNWRCRSGELDLIAEQDGCLVIVEVRTRKPSARFGSPQESVDGRKQLQVRRTAEVYLHQNRRSDSRIRFDVIAVRLDGQGMIQSLEHYPHAF